MCSYSYTPNYGYESAGWRRRNAGSERLERVSVRDLRYTHDAISPMFQTLDNRGQNVRATGMSLVESFNRMVKDPSEIDKIPKMKVMVHKGCYWVTDGNRRLFVYKRLYDQGLIRDVTVRFVEFDKDRFDSASTTDCDGLWVRVKGVGPMDEYKKRFTCNPGRPRVPLESDSMCEPVRAEKYTQNVHNSELAQGMGSCKMCMIIFVLFVILMLLFVAGGVARWK